MGRLGTAAVAMVFLGVALAGCTDSAGEPLAPSTSSTSAVTQGSGSASVSGMVVDEESLPVQGADVSIVSLPEAPTATTGADGTFSFAAIAPGIQKLVASKAGYKTHQVEVQVGAQEAVDGVQLRLVRVPDPVKPFMTVIPGEGFIACALKAGASTFTTIQFCEADPQHKPFYDFDVSVEDGLTSLVLELEWVPTLPGTATHLRQELWKNPNCDNGGCNPDIQYEVEQGRSWNAGESPLKMQFGSLGNPFREGLETTGATTLSHYSHVSRANDPLVVVVVQQPVSHYISLFHHSEPAPDYSALEASS